MKSLLVVESWIFKNYIDMAENKNEFKHLKVVKEDELKGYVKTCFSAMKTIAHNMSLVTNTEDPDSSVLERNYVLTLVFEIGKQISKYNETSERLELYSSELFVGGETNKFLNVNSDKVQKTCNDLEIVIKDSKFETIPDLVIHSSHDSEAGNTGEGQYLALEAKTAKKLGKFAFMKDFFKLNAYLASLNYENAIYLIVNSSAKQVESLIEEYINNGYFLNEGNYKLLFFIQETKDVEPIIYQFN